MPAPGLRRILAFLTLFLLLSSLHARSLQEIKHSGKLYVAFTEWDYRNINYPLALEFARYLNVKLIDVPIKWEEAFSKDGSIPPGLEKNSSLVYTPDALKKADIICSTFSTAEWRKRLFDFAETLYSAEFLLISSRNSVPKSFSELKGQKISFMSGTTCESHIQKINSEIGGGILLTPLKSDEESKKLLLESKVYGILLDADEALNFNAQNNNIFQLAFPVSPLRRSAWAVEKNSSLRAEIEGFFEAIAVNGVLDKIFADRFQIKFSSFVDRIRKTSRLETVQRDLDGILASKKLVVAFRDRNFIYKEGEHKQFMHALAQEFADYLGVKLDFVITPNSARYWENSEGVIVKDSSYTPPWFNYFDLACEIFAPAEWRTNKVNEVSIFPTEYMVVARKKTNLNSMNDLSNFEGVTTRGTVYEDMLEKRKIHKFHYADVDHFLEEVNSGKADYAIIMNAFFELSSFPELESKFSIGETEICWALRKDQPELEKKLQQFIADSRKNGLIRILDHALRGKEQYSPDELLNSYYESFQAGELPYVVYGTSDGLPQEDVCSIFQDERGYMWFGTRSGVARYNGREMKVLGRSQGWTGKLITGITEGTGGQILLASSDGVAIVQHDSIQNILYKGESFSNIQTDARKYVWLFGKHHTIRIDQQGKSINLTEKFPLLGKGIHSVLWSPPVAGWFLAGSDGVYYFPENEQAPVKLVAFPSFSIAADIHDSIWLSCSQGVYIISPDELKKNKFGESAQLLNNSLGISNHLIKQIIPSRYGHMWLLSDYRLFQVIKPGEKALVFEREIGLKNNTILSLFEDGEENLWIGFSGGLQRITNRKGLRNFYPGILNNRIHSLLEDKTGRFWIASENGIHHYKGQLADATGIEGIGKDLVVAGKLPDGLFLLAGEKRMVLLDAEKLRIIRQITFQNPLQGMEQVFISSKGEVFFLTGTTGLIYYLRHPGARPIALSGRVATNVHALIEYNGVVAGGNNSGLNAFNGMEFRQTHELGQPVWSLCYDDGDLWIGTETGLKKLDENGVSILNLPGLNNTVIRSVIPARNKSFLWVGTNRGFSYFSKESLTSEFTIDSGDGILSEEMAPGALFIDSHGILWIGSYNGLSNFNIRAATTRSYSPVCYIEKMTVNGINLVPGSKKIFSKLENNIQFEISALSFSDEQSIEYEFYLRGLGNDYTSYSLGKEFKAIFSNLPPGKYEFIYNARGKDGIWGYAQKFEFLIHRPWYESWAFRIAIIPLLLITIILLYRREKQNQKRINFSLKGKLDHQTNELREAQDSLQQMEKILSSQNKLLEEHEKNLSKAHSQWRELQKELLAKAGLTFSCLPEHFVLFLPWGIQGGFLCRTGIVDDELIVSLFESRENESRDAILNYYQLEALLNFSMTSPVWKADKLQTELEKVKGLDDSSSITQAENEGPANLLFCNLNLKTLELHFAATGMKIILLRSGKALNLNPINQTHTGEPSDPIQHRLPLLKGDLVYLFTQSVVSSNNATDNDAFTSPALLDFLIEIQHLQMEQQYHMLLHRMEKWHSVSPCLRDIGIIGFRI